MQKHVSLGNLGQAWTNNWREQYKAETVRCNMSLRLMFPSTCTALLVQKPASADGISKER